MDEACKIWPLELSPLEEDVQVKMPGRTKKIIKSTKDLIVHAWYMSPGSLTSLTCFMAQ